MYYRGSRVPLSEKNPRFRDAGMRSKSLWGGRFATVASHKERKEEKKFSLKLFVPKEKPVERPQTSNTVFYRPGVTNVPDAPVFSKREKTWTPKAPSLKSMTWLFRAAGFALLVAALIWSKQKATAALQDVAGLKLSKVQVEGNHYLTEDQVLEAVGLPLGENMFKLDLQDAVEKVRKLDWVERVFVERRLPSSILISIRERKPVALLDNGSLYGVDKDGRIMRPSTALLNEDLPLISGVHFTAEAEGTTQTAEALKPALDFFAFLKKKDAVLAQDVSEVNISEPDSLKVTFINGTQATFNTAVSETELKRMALVLSDLSQKGRTAGTLDFRYRDMVLVKTR